MKILRQKEFGIPNLGQIRTKIVRNIAAKAARQMRTNGSYMKSQEMAKRIANVGSESPYQNTVRGWQNKQSVINSAKMDGLGIETMAGGLVRGIQKLVPKGNKLSSSTFKRVMKDQPGVNWDVLAVRKANTLAQSDKKALFGKGRNHKKLNKKIVNAVTNNSGHPYDYQHLLKQ